MKDRLLAGLQHLASLGDDQARRHLRALRHKLGLSPQIPKSKPKEVPPAQRAWFVVYRARRMGISVLANWSPVDRLSHAAHDFGRLNSDFLIYRSPHMGLFSDRPWARAYWLRRYQATSDWVANNRSLRQIMAQRLGKRPRLLVQIVDGQEEAIGQLRAEARVDNMLQTLDLEALALIWKWMPSPRFIPLCRPLDNPHPVVVNGGRLSQESSARLRRLFDSLRTRDDWRPLVAPDEPGGWE